MDEDLYALFGIEYTATKKQIGFAFRQLSLTCHPDKVGDKDATSVDRFIKLTKAYEILRDPSLKRDYDARYKAKIENIKKINEMDIKRRTDTLDLDERERVAKRQKEESNLNAYQMNIEIERLRAEGHRFMKEQEDRVNKEKELVMMAVYKQQSDRPQGLEATLTVKWSKKIRNYTEQEIRLLFESLGVCQVVFSRKETNRGSAIIEFDSILNASNIIDAKLKFDTQFTDFTITWTAGSAPMILDQLKRNQRQEMNELSNMTTLTMSFEEYEKYTLSRMRQAIAQV